MSLEDNYEIVSVHIPHMVALMRGHNIMFR